MPFSRTTGYDFSEAGISKYAPRGSGVYGIYNSSTWIYVGEAGDMEARLYAHLGVNPTRAAGSLGKNLLTMFLKRSMHRSGRLVKHH